MPHTPLCAITAGTLYVYSSIFVEYRDGPAEDQCVFIEFWRLPGLLQACGTVHARHAGLSCSRVYAPYNSFITFGLLSSHFMIEVVGINVTMSEFLS